MSVLSNIVSAVTVDYLFLTPLKVDHTISKTDWKEIDTDFQMIT